MRKALIALLTAIGLMFGVGMASPAQANSLAATKVWNDTPDTIGVEFHTLTTGHWVWMNVGPYQWQGEVYGNMEYEPRIINLGADWCLDYYFWVQGSAPGPTYQACGGIYGGKLNIYLGDGFTTNYDVHVNSVWYRGY